MKRMRVIVSLGVVVFLTLAGLGKDGASTTRPVAATTTRATTAPATRPVHPDVMVARQMIDAGDPRIIPTLMDWLASEQDVPVVGSGSARLREAIRGARELQVVEAVPWLLNVRGNSSLEELASGTALLISPEATREFATEQLERGRGLPWSRATPLVAAGALIESANDETARGFLLAQYRAVLNERVKDRKVASLIVDQVRRLDDAATRDRVVELAGKYPPEIRAGAEQVAEQVRLNALPPKALIGICEDESKDKTQRHLAVVSLAWHGTPEVLEQLDKLAAREKASADAGAEGPEKPEATLDAAVAATTIRRRYRLGKAPFEPPRPRAPAIGVPEAQPVTDGGAEGIVMHCTGVSVDPSGADETAYLGLVAYDGSTSRLRVRPANDRVLKIGQSVDFDGIVLAALSRDQKQVLSMRPLDPAPGELTRDGYVLVETLKVTDGKTQRMAVRLSKYGRQFVARIPNRTGAGGAIVSDSAMIRAVRGVSPGQVVEARFEEEGRLTMLSWIGRYRPAVRGAFVRRLDVQGEQGVGPGIEVEAGGKRRTYVLPAAAGPRPPALDPAMIEALVPGCELRLTVEGDPMLEADRRPSLRDVRIDGTVFRSVSGTVAGVRVRRATWTSGNSMAWNYIEGEPAVLHLALSRFSEDKTNALGLPPDKAAVLNEVFRLAETPDISFVQREQRPLQQALEKEGSRRRQEALEQRMCLSVQRFVVQVDDLMRKQIARVKETLSEEQYKALLALGGRRGNP